MLEPEHYVTSSAYTDFEDWFGILEDVVRREEKRGALTVIRNNRTEYKALYYDGLTPWQAYVMEWR